MNDIQWKYVKEFPNYRVSNTGLIHNTVTDRLLKGTITSSGYKVVQLQCIDNNHNKIHKNYKVHRLVAMYFSDNYSEDKAVHHKDLNKLNNNINNLLCVTNKEHWDIHREINKRKDNINV